MFRKFFFTNLFFIFFIISSLYGQVKGDVEVGLKWRLNDGKTAEKTFAHIDIAKLSKKGVWLYFKDDKVLVYADGNIIGPDISLKTIETLYLSVSFKGKPYETVIFGKDHLYGPKIPYQANVYHLLVLDDFVEKGALGELALKNDTLSKDIKASFVRTNSMAMSYAIQSDAYARELETLYEVAASYKKARFIMVSEEWLDIPEEVKSKPKKSGGLFGGALDDVAAEIAGETKVVSSYKPTYSMSVLSNEIEVSGEHKIAFQTARSLWNDILEGKVVYEGVKNQGRVLTATVVFSQMEKNKAEKKGKNERVVIDSSTLEKLNGLEALWPQAKESISDFLKKNESWKTVIPRHPVAFYDKEGNFLYAMYAWFNFQPQSGKMVGMLPSDIHGSRNEVWNKYEKKAIMKTKEMIEERAAPGTSAVKFYLSTVAGMYVSSGGVLSAVNLAISDPRIANLSDEEWKEFVALHSMEFCKKFMEEQADVYDSYETIAGFWMGACAITNKLGGPGPGGVCLKNGYDAMKKKFIDDAKKKATKMLEDGKKQGEKAIDDRVDQWRDSKAKDIAKDLAKTRDTFRDMSEAIGNAKEKVDEIGETVDDTKTVYDEIAEE